MSQTSQSRTRSLTDKWVSKLIPFDTQKTNYIKKYLKGFNLKKRFTYQELVSKEIIMNIENSIDKENLVFDVVYYPNTKAVVLQASVNGRYILPNTITATLAELVDARKNGVTELVVQDKGQLWFQLHCQNLCLFIRDVYLGVVCPKCEIKYDRKCRNCSGKGLIPDNVQVCFRCYGSSYHPKGTKTTCSLCKGKGFLDPTWHKCQTCNGVGSKLQKDQGGSFVYPCDGCNSLGYYIGSKVVHGLQHEDIKKPEVSHEDGKIHHDSVDVPVKIVEIPVEEQIKIQQEEKKDEYVPPPPPPDEVTPTPSEVQVFDRNALKKDPETPKMSPRPIHETTQSLLNIKIEQPTPETLVINGVVHDIRPPETSGPHTTPNETTPSDNKEAALEKPSE